jgi:hypothetical protein
MPVLEKARRTALNSHRVATKIPIAVMDAPEERRRGTLEQVDPQGQRGDRNCPD